MDSLFESAPDTNTGVALRDDALNQLRERRPELIRACTAAALRVRQCGLGYGLAPCSSLR